MNYKLIRKNCFKKSAGARESKEPLRFFLRTQITHTLKERFLFEWYWTRQSIDVFQLYSFNDSYNYTTSWIPTNISQHTIRNDFCITIPAIQYIIIDITYKMLDGRLILIFIYKKTSLKPGHYIHSLFKHKHILFSIAIHCQLFTMFFNCPSWYFVWLVI